MKRKSDLIIKKYNNFLTEVTVILEEARHSSARVINTIITTTYWEIGKRIVLFEQAGKKRAQYGKSLLKKLSKDLTVKFKKGFSVRNLEQMRLFYLTWEKPQTMAAISSDAQNSQPVAANFPLPWTHYIRLLSIKDKNARNFYEYEAIRNGWSKRQLYRQIDSMFYERTALSRNKTKMLNNVIGIKDLAPEEEIKDPYILEFLGLKDEYSESDLEESLIKHLEHFLLELGGDFAFIGRQKRLRIGNEWYKVDLLFFHRKLKCLVVIDLKIGKFTHADAGQMHMYLNYASENWTNIDENPPVGLILCAEKDSNVVKYALDNLPNKILASEYKLVLPDEKDIERELIKSRKMLEK